jgi:hypothetical protein
MKLNSFKIRSSLWGTTALAITSILFCMTLGCGQDKMDTDNLDSPPPIVSEVSTTWITTSTVTTSSTSTSTTSTTTTTTTEETTLRIETTVVTTNQTIAAAANSIEIEEETPTETEPVFETTWIESEPTWTNENDIVLLAKLINHEASNSYEGKVMVGSCVVNRMNIKGFSVSDVIFEQGQFTTAYSLSIYTDLDYQAAQQVLSYGSSDTRIYYFDGCHPDGLNWFYDINRNYLGAW